MRIILLLLLVTMGMCKAQDTENIKVGDRIVFLEPLDNYTYRYAYKDLGGRYGKSFAQKEAYYKKSYIVKKVVKNEAAKIFVVVVPNGNRFDETVIEIDKAIEFNEVQIKN